MTSLLAVGVRSYAVAGEVDPSFDDLDYAVSDALRFARVSEQNLKTNAALVLTSESAGGEQATRNNILRSLNELVRSRVGGVIVYFAGHGIDVAGRLHLCPQDFDPRIDSYSSIGVSEIVEMLSKRHNWCILIVDACRGTIWNRASKARMGGVVVADNACILLASSNGEQAWETPSINGQIAGGVFTYFLCRRLEDASRPHRRISLGDVFEGAQEDTSAFASQSLQRQQTPRSVGMSPGDIFLPARPRRGRSSSLPARGEDSGAVEIAGL